MKKNLFYYLFAVLCTVTMFTSCSNNDEPGGTSPVATDLAGKYKGVLNVSIFQDDTEIPGGTVDPQFISVENSGDNVVNLSITDFSFMGIEIGDINLDNCMLTANGDAYDFTGTTTVDAAVLTADVNAVGSFSNGTLKLDLDIDALVGRSLTQKVKVTYSGTRVNGNESNEAKIVSFVFDVKDNEANAIVVSDPVINHEEKTVSFIYAKDATSEQLATLVPTIQVSDGATVDPASGVAQDFSKEVTYTVTAADGTTIAVYTVKASKQVITESERYDFSDWVSESYDGIMGDGVFDVPQGWKTSNAGIIEMTQYADELGNPGWSVLKDDNAGADGVAMIQTQNTKGKFVFIARIPTITAGTFFLGNWSTNPLDALKSTKFGNLYDTTKGRPTQIKVRYKYESGKDYYTCEGTTIDKATHKADKGEYADKFSIKASFYTAEGIEDEKFSDYLTGVAGEENFYTSSRVVSKGELVEGSTDGAWKEATITLNEFEMNPDQKYRFTIVCSSSYEGDKFYGAPGSKLWIDSIEIVYQK